MDDEDILHRAKQTILDDQSRKLTRDETQQYYPSQTLIFKPDEHLNVSSFERGNEVLGHVLHTIKADDFSVAMQKEIGSVLK